MTAQPGNYQPIWHCTGAETDSEFGHYLVSAGDQNMDGYDDILIANWVPREVYLYYGGPTGQMDTIPDMVFTEEYEFGYGNLPLECRDLNGDSYPDFCISADFGSQPNSKTYIYFGGPLLDNQADLVLEPDTSYISPYTGFGGYLSMGDFNGDGDCDLAISAWRYDLDVGWGKLYVFYGGQDIDSIPDFSVTAEPNDIYGLGDYISCSGDVNNDGFDDIVVRDNHGTYPPAYDGRMAFLGGAEPDTIPDWEFRTFGGYPFTMGYGSLITPDVNNDGYDDILIRADVMYSCDASLFYGGEEVDTLWDVHLDGDGDWSSGCAYAGDVNGDGWGDVMLNDWVDGKINVFFLHPGMGSVKSYDLLLEFPFVAGGNGGMGYAGDVNGDGVDDFMFTFNDGDLPLYDQVFIYSDTSLAGVVKPEIRLSIPEFTLHQNYPNPFNQRTVIPFTLDWAGKVKIDIFNITGRSVGVQQAAPLHNWFSAGTHEVVWNAEGMASGTYLVRLQQQSAGTLLHTEQASVRKVVLVK